VTGALTRDTLVAGSQPTVSENLTGVSPSVDGTVTVRDKRSYAIVGYVNTSHGRVWTSVSSSLAFTNAQKYSNESPTTGTLAASQTTDATTTVLTTGPGTFGLERRIISFPISVLLDTVLDSSGTGTQVGTIDQHFIEVDGEIGPSGIFASYASNEVKPTDTLDILDGEYITGNANQSSSQKYDVIDTRGTCYSQTVKAASNLVTAVSNAPCDSAAVAPLLRSAVSP
jgi:hypothetical protein